MTTKQNNFHEVSVYRGFGRHVANMPLKQIIETVRTDEYSLVVAEIRAARQAGDKDEADTIKSSLGAFTTAGTFNGPRNSDTFLCHSGVIGLDHDDLGSGQVLAFKEKVATLPYTLAAFVSPSGTGVKTFVTAQGVDQDNHVDAYKAVQKFYEEATGYPADPKCKDLPRLCYVSYDPDAYWNEDCQPFPWKDYVSSPQKEDVENVSDTTLERVRKFTDKVQGYTQGNRNNYLHFFGCNANRYGVPMPETINYCIREFAGLSSSETTLAIESAYRTNPQEFAKFDKFVRHTENANDDDDDGVTDLLSATPCIPDWVYESSPALLVDGVKAFSNPRQRDLYFSTAICLYSGCIPHLRGVYRRRTVYANLYFLGVAPPASGKDAAVVANETLDILHQEVSRKSSEEMMVYKTKAKEIKEAGGTPPPPPKQRTLRIPGNVTSSKMVKHLGDNDGAGIFFECEADTIVNSAKMEHCGMNSEMARKGFHGEPISISRKTGNELIEVKNPHPAMATLGTPIQAVNYIGSAENGFMSRNMFYLFSSPLVWEDVSPAGQGPNLTELAQSLGIRVQQMVNFLEDNPTDVDLTVDQWERLNNKFSRYLKEVTVFIPGDSPGIVMRLGLILFRICMVLTAIRKFENRDTRRDIQCSDSDFNVAEQLIEVYLEHSLAMLTLVSRRSKKSPPAVGHNKRAFFEALPAEFKREEAVSLGEAFGYKSSAIDKLLKKLVKSDLLSKSDYGQYIKLS